MAIGEAFVNVRADLKPFSKDLEKGLKVILKEAEKKIVADADTGKGIAASLKKNLGDGVDEGLSEGGRRGGRSGSAQALKGFERFFAGLADFVDDGLSAIPGRVKAALLIGLIAAAIAAAPLIGSVIAAAVTSGLALGVIGLGIAIASQLKPVNDAFRALGRNIIDDLRARAQVFIEPLLRSASDLDVALRKLGGTISRTFAQASLNINDLTQGVIGFLNELLPRIQQATTAARPLIRELATQLPKIGEAIGRFFTIIASSSPEATQGLRDFVFILTTAIVATAMFIRDLATLYFWLRIIARLQQGDAVGAARALEQRNLDVAAATGEITNQLQELNPELSETAAEAKAARAAISSLLTAMLSGVDASIDYEQALDDLQKSIKEGNKEFRITEENGRKNVRIIEQGIVAAGRKRDAAISDANATEESIASANAAYDAQINKLEQTVVATGHETEALQTLFDKAREAPDKVSIAVETPGLGAALDGFRRLAAVARAGALAAANAIKTANGGSGLQGTAQYAAGTITTGPEIALIGEAGREAVIPDPASHPGRAMQLSNQFGLTSMIADALGATKQTIVNVYLGTQRLQEMVDYRIGFNGMQQAQSIAYGPRPA